MPRHLPEPPAQGRLELREEFLARVAPHPEARELAFQERRIPWRERRYFRLALADADVREHASASEIEMVRAGSTRAELERRGGLYAQLRSHGDAGP